MMNKWPFDATYLQRSVDLVESLSEEEIEEENEEENEEEDKFMTTREV